MCARARGTVPSLRVDVRGCACCVCAGGAAQIYVKPPEMLTRDRLLGAYQVRPVLDTLKTSLLGLAGARGSGLCLPDVCAV